MSDTRKTTRMYCDICGSLHKIDFAVPDNIWDACMHPRYKKCKVCINCFMERADEQLLKWDECITFTPTSFATQLDIQIEHIIANRNSTMNHVCSAQGFNPNLGDICPACEIEQIKFKS